MTRKPLLNIYSDASSLVLRALLREPGRKWKANELAGEGVSLGLVSEVLSRAEALGYVERVVRGPVSYSRLIRGEELLKSWTVNYRFERNRLEYYFYPGRDFLKVCGAFLKKAGIPYAMTLYSASRLISPYVKDDREFVYLGTSRGEFADVLARIEAELGLYKLVKGGNVCFASPFYLCSLFRDVRRVKGYPLVSWLQLYLDLMTFPPAGPEEMRHLIPALRKEGAAFV